MQIKTKKIISSLLIISILAPSVLFAIPKKVNAVAGVADTSTDPILVPIEAVKVAPVVTGAAAGVASAGTQASGLGISIKTWYGQILDQLLMAIAKKALQAITKSVISWINSGFHGSPLFLENSQSFFTDIAKTEIKTLVNQFGYDPNKFPFGQAWALNTINSYKRTLDQNASYSLNSAMTTTQATNFRNNFNVGGWNGFLINTQYPQNNYLGFNMMATDQLARQLQGYSQTATQQVQTTLQQGQGFLSPQTCQTNPNYNNMTNEFQKPEFHYDVPYPKYTATGDEINDVDVAAMKKWNDDKNTAQAAFNSPTGSTNCPKKADGSSGLINTTPGSVVSSQIMGSLSAGKDATVLGTALGTGLSAIFDALLNHFLDKGLNALASTVNPAPAQDTWTYGGQNLNINGTSSSVWNGPDEEIILDKFKKQISGETDWTAKEGEKIIETGDTRVGTCSGIKDSKGTSLPDITSIPNAQCVAKKGTWVQDADGKTYFTATATIPAHTDRIAVAGETISEVGDTTGGDPTKGTYIPGDIVRTQEEISLMDNFDSSDPMNAQNRPNGIIQSIGGIILNTQTLDQCLPGPDKGWEKRLDDEKNMVERPLSNQAGNPDELKQRAANAISKELKFAVTSFKDWISTKMMLSLPSAVLDIDAIQSINDFSQQLTETTTSKRTKGKALAMLTVIKASLDPIKSQPDPGSADEKIMINMKKQYNAIQADISSTNTIESTRAELVTLNKQLEKVINLDAGCEGGTTTNLDASGNPIIIPWEKSERYIAGWGRVDRNTITGTGKGLSVNGKLKGITFPLTRSTLDITSNEDYGLTFVTGGISNLFSGNSWSASSTTQTTNYTTNGTELEQFCGLPIATGYSHGDVIRQDSSNGYGSYALGSPSLYTFRNLDDPRGIVVRDVSGKIILDYTGVPMVNGQTVYGDINCTGTCSWGMGGFAGKPSNDTISIDISCSAMWKANPMDYTHAGDLTQ